MKTRVVRQTVIDRRVFSIVYQEEFSIEETTELRSERQIKAAVSQQLATREKKVHKGWKFYYIIKRKREMSF